MADNGKFSKLLSGRHEDLIAASVNDSTSGPNVTVFCQADYVPSLEEYFTAFNVVGVVLFTLGGCAVFITVFIFADTLRNVIRNAPPRVKTHSAFVLSVYPVVTIATYCAVLVPRAQLLAEAVTQGMFMASLYQLFCLLVAYCGGEADLIASVKPNLLKLQVGPCCCYPCCLLPQLTVNKRNVRFLRLLILQLPVVQGLVYMVLLVMWAEEESLYQVNYVYVQPVIVTSILFGIWGMLMTIKMLAEVLKDYHMQGKFLVLQLVLLFAKLQGIVARILVWTGSIPCRPPITAAVYANLFYNSIMLGEMVVLSVIARVLYIKTVPHVKLSVKGPYSITEDYQHDNAAFSIKDEPNITDSLKNNVNNGHLPEEVKY